MSQCIVIDPEVCGGRLIVAGTRIRVSDILDALAAGDGIDELLGDFSLPKARGHQRVLRFE